MSQEDVNKLDKGKKTAVEKARSELQRRDNSREKSLSEEGNI